MEIDKIISFGDNQKPLMELSEQKKQEFHYIGKAKKRNGHTLFSYNVVTGEIKRADIQECHDVDFKTRQPVRNTRVVIEKDCIYRQALNKKNFIKVLLREGWIKQK